MSTERSTPGGDAGGAVDAARIAQVEQRIRHAYRTVELAVREGTMLVGHDGSVVDAIRAEERIGIEFDRLVGGPPLPNGWRMFDEVGAPLDAAEHPVLRALRSGVAVDQIVTYEAPSGEQRDLKFVAYPVADDADVAVDVVVADHDRRQRTREALERQEDRFRTMTDMLPVAVWEAAATGQVTYVNPRFTEMTGLAVPDVPDLPMMELVHPDDLLSVMEAATEAAAEHRYHSQYRLMHVDRSFRWVTSRMSVLVDDHGTMNGFAGSIEDIDELRRSERRSARLADIVEAAGDVIGVIERGVATYVNRAGKLLLERTDPAFVTDRSNHTFLHQFLDRYNAEANAALKATGVWSSDVSLVDVDGDAVDLALTVRAELEDGAVVRSVVMARDIGDQKRRESRLAHDAVHDPLTGLANRHGLDRAVAALVDEPDVDVLFVDIDHFKSVNDTLGHVAGDAMLVDVAARVRHVVGDGAVVARVGGDEMLVVRPVGSEPAGELAERLVDAVSANPVAWNGQTWPVTVTIGVATGSVSGLDALKVAADRALYRAKAAGRGTWRVSAG